MLRIFCWLVFWNLAALAGSFGKGSDREHELGLEAGFEADEIHVYLNKIIFKSREGLSNLFVMSKSTQEVVILRLGNSLWPKDQILQIISHLIVDKFLQMMIGAVVGP